MSLESRKNANEFFSRIANYAADSIIAVDKDLKIIFFNREAEKVFGYSSNEIMGQPLNILIPARYHARHEGHVQKFADSDVTARLMNDDVGKEVLALRRDGTEFFAEISILKIDQDMVAIVRDVTKRKDFEEQLKYLAEYDSLTGVMNRRKIEEVAKKEIGRALRYERQLSLLLIDIDHFKKINDSFGHDIGDFALKHLVSVCREVLREIDFIGRWGGEEFMVLLPEVDRKVIPAVAEKLRNAVEVQPVKLEGLDEIEFTISLGGVVCREPTQEWETYLKLADNALYQAKAQGRNRFHLNEE